MKILYLQKVEIYLFKLIRRLYYEQYFSFPEQAIEYVQKIKQYIENHIKTAYKQKAPEYFFKYGKNMYYFTYKANLRTTWYIFFQQRDNVYLIRYITNNHVSAQHFDYGQNNIG